MILTDPVIITPRLLPGVQVSGVFISIEYSKLRGDDGRTRYRYYIDLETGCYTGDNIQSGCGGGSLQAGLESLLGFLAACGEAVSYSDREEVECENSNLFPPNIGGWAAENIDELSMLELELQENGDAIEE